MECNKEEAIRAKEIAEKKLQEQDYASAKKIALKAERLFPQLENISQLLTVCEVHSSAQLKLNGQHDWYKILQVEPTSDEILIRKQYRKLALLLHPDKNKLPGAEAAFKLVGEANNTLSDRSKRTIYDVKRENNARSAAAAGGPQQQQSSKPNNAAHKSSSSNFNNSAKPQSYEGFTFWTACPNCKTRHQYYRNMLGKIVRCLNCSTVFTATALPHLNPGRDPPQHFSTEPQPQRPGSYKSTCSRGGGVGGGGTTTRKPPESNPNPPKPSMSNSSAAANTTTGQRRGKRVSADTSESNANDTNPSPNPNPSSDVNPTRVSADTSTSTLLRRSPRNKPSVNYSNTGAGVSSPNKKARIEVREEQQGGNGGGTNATTNTTTNAGTGVEREVVGEKDREKGKEKVEPSTNDGTFPNSCTKNSIDAVALEKGKEKVKPSTNDGAFPNSCTKTSSNAAALSEEDSQAKFVYPDPEFCDFDKLKDIRKFAVNQIWALYDNLDAMPRFYAHIRNVCTEPDFQVKYTWLEHDPVNEAEVKWSDEELPVGCGNYSLGETETTDDRLIFSHIVFSEKVKKKGGGSYVILPRKGEIWALFKNWDNKWSREVERRKKYEYEVVEVLSDFSRTAGVTLVPLIKVQGFVSVFLRAQNSVPIHVPPGEILRFSHSIPSYRLNGTERDNLPEGSLELDTVALPSNFGTAFPSVPIDPIKHRTPPFDPSNGDTSRFESPPQQPNADAQSFYQYPDAEFHNFDMCRTCNQFQRGQIWALYSDLDTFPKYYGFIRKVEPEPFKVHISWLEACPKSEVEKQWLGADFPISCGKFKVTNQSMTYDSPDTFSHLVTVKHHHGRGGGYYEILPEVGEIWAVYKNWSAGWTLDDFEKCEFDVVEIKEQRDQEGIVVWPLRQVPEYRSVFMPERVSGSGVAGSRVIPATEFIIFSHRIPATCLTEERGGKLRGFWELDPASVPDAFLYCDK